MREVVTGAIGAITAGALVLPLVDARLAANVAIVVIAVAAWAFVALYGARSRWRITTAGRSVMYAMTALSLFATQVSVSAWLGSSYTGRDEIRFLLYWFLAVTLVNLVVTLLREQRADRHERACKP